MVLSMHVLYIMVLPHGNGLLVSFVRVVCSDGDLFARYQFDRLIRVLEKPCSDFWSLQQSKAAALGYMLETPGLKNIEFYSMRLTLVSSITAHMMRVFFIAILKLSSVSCVAVAV